MKGSVKIILWAVVFVLGATLLIYGVDIWDVTKKQPTGINEEIRIKGPTGPPYVKGPTSPPPNY